MPTFLLLHQFLLQLQTLLLSSQFSGPKAAEVWFAIKSLTVSKTKFYHAVASLPQDVAAQILQRLERTRQRVHDRQECNFVRGFCDDARRVIVRGLSHQAAGTRTRPSISTRALRLMIALVTVHSPSTCVASAPTRNVPEG